MVNKHEEMFTILRDVQMKITMRLSHSVRMAGIGKQRERNAGDDARNKEPLSTAGVITMEVRMVVSPKANYRSTYDTAIACEGKQVNILH